MSILDKYSIILDELDFASELINIKTIKHSNITVAMYIVFTRIKELFPKEISNIIILEYEMIVNDIIANEAEISDDNANNQCQNFIHAIRYSFYDNNYDIQNKNDQEYFIFHDKKMKTDFIKLSCSTLKKLLSVMIKREINFFIALKE